MGIFGPMSGGLLGEKWANQSEGFQMNSSSPHLS